MGKAKKNLEPVVLRPFPARYANGEAVPRLEQPTWMEEEERLYDEQLLKREVITQKEFDAREAKRAARKEPAA